MTRHVVLLLVGTVLFCLGCARKLPDRPVDAVGLLSIDAPGLARLIEKHRGQVVLVDFWATWCGPCLELFPHTIELHRELRDRRFTVITVSLDDPDNRAAVRAFLVEAGATTENYLASYGIGSAAFDAFNIGDGSLPHVQLYDRRGEPRKSFSSGGKTIDPNEVRRAVEELLK